MDVVYAHGKATATDVLAALPDPPSRASVRTLLRILEEKGHLAHAKRGREFVYSPTHPRGPAGRSALRRVLSTFFDNSLEKAVAAHLSESGPDLTADELDRLSELIRKARKEDA